ncbi:MAG: hypothetical protein KatS3mg131_3725 [Candidatus Tectimicrobiota bacterium]|nr:MAG: hypothetical protein KatS3mg131_3725 [Candidatus Tectomicrobia bacterium]
MKTTLAYLHPLLQVLALLIALATLRLGLALKGHRGGRRRVANWAEIFERHTQLGLLGVGLLSGGYLLGLLSMPLLRQRPPLRSAHFFFATLALALFLAGGYSGWRLKRGTKKYAEVRDLHGFLVYLGLFLSLGAAIMGFALLP